MKIRMQEEKQLTLVLRSKHAKKIYLVSGHLPPQHFWLEIGVAVLSTVVVMQLKNMKNDIPIREIGVPDPHHPSFLNLELIKNLDLTTKKSVLGLALAEVRIYVTAAHVRVQGLVVVLVIQDHALDLIREVANGKGIAQCRGTKFISKFSSFIL